MILMDKICLAHTLKLWF